MATLWNARSTDTSIAPAHHLWSTLVFGGLAQLALGAVGLLVAGVTTLVSVIVFGVLLAVGGVVELVQAFRFRSERRGLLLYLLAGVLSLLAGLSLLFNPLAGALSLTLLIAGLLVAAGVFRIVGATMQNVPGSGWAFVSGALTIMLGVLLLIDWPASSFWSIGAIVSANLIVTGFAHMLLGFELRNLALRAAGHVATAGPIGPGGVGPAGAV